MTKIRSGAALVAAALLLSTLPANRGAFADEMDYGVAPTGAIVPRVIRKDRQIVAPAPIETFVAVADEPVPGAPVPPEAVAPPVPEVVIVDEPVIIDGPAIDSGGPVVIEEVPPPVYAGPDTGPSMAPYAAPTAPQPRRLRRSRMRFRLTLEGAASLIDNPDGGLGESVSGGATPYDWSQNEFDPSFGGRLGLSWTPGNCHQFEVRGTYYGEWDANSTQNGSFGFRPPAGGTSPAATATFASEAKLYTGEANYWYQSKSNNCLCLKWGLGFRYLNFEDEAAVTGLPIPPTVGGTGSLYGEAENEFFGAQLMFGGDYAVDRKLSIDFSVKALLGSLERRIRVNDDSILAGGLHSASRETDDFGWGGELRLGVSYAITPCWRITAAYELLYMADVSRAHSSFDFSQGQTGAVQAGDTKEDLVVHSLFLGLTFDF